MLHRPLVFLDIETTGFGPDVARVLEVGALRVENGQIVQKYQTLVHPESPVPMAITRLTGITNDDVADKPVFSLVAPELTALMEGAIFVAHNVDFDYGFLRAEYARLGAPFNYDRLCTVRLSRRLYPHERSHKLDSVIKRGGYRVAERHRAFDDAEVLYKFFQDSHAAFGLELFRHIDRLVTYAKTRKPRATFPGATPLPL